MSVRFVSVVVVNPLRFVLPEKIRKNMKKLSLTAIVVSLISITTGANAGVDPTLAQAVGYDKLLNQMGPDVPDGQRIHMTHVEASWNGAELTHYFPIINDYHFGGTQITDKSGAPQQTSPHATSVAVYLYSKYSSLASGIKNVEVFQSDLWTTSQFLGEFSWQAPNHSTNNSRVYNHSYVSNDLSISGNINALQRMDYHVQRDQVMHVVGNGGPTGSVLFHHAYNALSVGRIRPFDRKSTNYLSALYPAGRTNPNLVVAHVGSASDATPVAASAAAILMDYSQANPQLSNGSFIANGQTINHADAVPVVKSIMMAGASRSRVSEQLDGITTYTLNTDNNLDLRFGAGALDVFNSMQMLKAGETNSLQDGGSGAIGTYGFDYDPSFGGRNKSNSSATYQFTASPGKNILTASLNWLLDVDNNDASGFNPEIKLHNLDLFLYDTTSPQNPTLVAASQSNINNSENLHIALTNQRQYELVVQSTGADFEIDYGLAWRLTPEIGDFDGSGNIDINDAELLMNAIAEDNLEFDLDGDQLVNSADLRHFLKYSLGIKEGDANQDGIVNLQDIATMATHYNAQGSWAQGDFTGDGIIDLYDFAKLATNFSAVSSGSLYKVESDLPGAAASGPLLSSPTTSIPEPSALFLLFGTITTLTLNRKQSRLQSSH